MIARKLTSLCLLGFVTTAGLAGADTFLFTGQGDDNNWINAANWINTDSTGKTGVPDDTDDAKIGNATVVITTAVTVGYLRNGSDRLSGTVIIDGGSLVTAGTNEYNSASYKSPGSIIVRNGGSALFNSYFMVGYKTTQGGSVVINKGTVRVAGSYSHSIYYDGTEVLDTRTTINPDGLLDVNKLVLNAGVMDLAGGTLIVRKNLTSEVEQWIKEGRMIAMGGQAGWKIKVIFDDVTRWTTIIAEPAAEPVTVGRLNPGPPVPSRPAA